MKKFLLTAAALALMTTTAVAENGPVIVTTPVQGCAKVTTECRELPLGTTVVETNYWGNTSCVLPDGAPPPCLWVKVSALSYPKGYQPVRMTQEQMDQNQKDRRYAGEPPTPGDKPNHLQIQFQRGTSNNHYATQLVSLRNTSNNDYAEVAWTCKFYDKDGFTVGEGAAVFHLVRKQSVTFDSMIFPLNVAIGLVAQLKCDLLGVEPVTKENARLYRPGRSWGTQDLNSYLWQGRYMPQGDAVAPPVGSDALNWAYRGTTN